MARKSNSIFEDIADITSKFPWWVGVFLALVSFIFLHSYAGKELPAITVSGVDGLFKNISPSLLRTLAFFGQIIIPAAFLLGSLVSILQNLKRTSLYDKTSRSASQDALHNMSWKDFEFLVGEYFRRRHFTVEETKDGADGGVDLIATKDREKYLIQCKHGKAYKVGVEDVRELLGVLVGAGATGGIVVTSGEFTEDARAFARANNIILLTGKELHNNMQSYVGFEDQPRKKTGWNLQKVQWALLGLLVVAICSTFLDPGKSGRIFYSIFPAFLSDEHRQTKDSHINTPSKQTEPKDIIFTGDQIKKVTEDVLSEKKNEQLENIKAGRKGEEQKYRYEIELFSGGWIYTDNATITDKEVTYKSDKGLVVSLNRDEVKNMKKVKVGE